MLPSRLTSSLRRVPPLEAGAWALRHRLLRALVLGQALVVVTLGVIDGWWTQTPVWVAVFGASLGVSGTRRVPPRVQECAVAFGLFSVSAAVVQLADGNTAAHFHYFVMLPLLALYEDGLPFAVGVAYVVVQHGLMGSLMPHMVYTSGEGEPHPWRGAAVHGLAVLGASAGLRIHWRGTQAIRRSDRRSRKQAERYFDRAGAMLIDLDVDGRVRAVNPAACAILGRERAALVNANWFSLVLGVDATAPIVAAYAAVIRGESPVFEHYDNVIVRPDGGERAVSWQSELLTDDEGSITGLLCSGLDVTERRQAELQLAQDQRDLTGLHQLARLVAQSDDARPIVVEHVRQLTDAAWVALVEPDDDPAILVVKTVTAGCPLADQQIDVNSETSVVGRVFRTGEELLVSEIDANQTASTRLHALIPDTRSIYYLPIATNGGVAAVLAVGWNALVPSVTERKAVLVALAAREAAIALERLAHFRRLELIAMTDVLTELPNRRSWDRELPIAMARATRSGKPLAVALLDLNEFKALNDTQGHEAGDHLLQTAATGWRAVLRTTDLLARLGGDEFAAIVPDCDPAHADTVIGRLKDAVPHAAGVSVGIAYWDGEEAGDALLRRADRALYRDKADSRATHISDPDRLDALAATGLVAAASAGTFDRVTEVVAELLNVPVALVSLVDDAHQHFVGMAGLQGWAADTRSTPLTHSFCKHTVATGRPLVVNHADTDPLVKDNLAIPDLGVHAYAGMPLTTTDGYTLGALCAIDNHPREWTAHELATLEAVAAQLSNALNTRSHDWSSPAFVDTLICP